MQSTTLEAVFDEMEKIAASKGQAGYMQSRSGRRSMRVSTLMAKGAPDITEPDQTAQDPEADPGTPANPEDESGEKMAADDLKTKALGGFASARPYVASAFKAGVPAALLGGVMGGPRAAKVMGAVGAGLGVTNEALENWAEKNKRKAVARKILEK
jgi:hypothetical protein